jgi:signal transduction histidine kinase/ligand-binding sensor domain-containing protein
MWAFAWFLAGLACVFFPRPAHALDPDRAMSQYLRDRWEIEQGFPGGAVSAIAQTPDGYLWIGTETGLVRFDGLQFRIVQPTTPGLPSLRRVLGLAVDSQGRLWVRQQGPDVLRYQNGQFVEVMPALDRAEVGVTAMARAHDGDVLLSALMNGVVRHHGAAFVPLAAQRVLSRSLVISIADTPDGTIWLGTRDAGLFSLRDGQQAAVSGGLPNLKINCLLPLGDRAVWIGTDDGVVRWNGREIAAAGVPAALAHVQALAMLADREANIWIGTASQGLLRVNARGVSALDTASRGASGTHGAAAAPGAPDAPGTPGIVTALFEDREGTLWIGGTRGLARLRDSAFVTYAAPDLPLPDSVGPIHVDAHDRTWLAPATGGLRWLRDGQVGNVAAGGLSGDVIYSIAGSHDDVWVGRQRGGLTRLRPAPEGGFDAQTYTQADGLAQNSVYVVYQSRDAAVWAGTLSAGVSRLKDGAFTTYTTEDGLASNSVSAIVEGVDGTMWFGTPNGLSAWSGGRWRRYAAADGLPSAALTALARDAAGRIWIGTAQGLAFFADGRVQTPRDAPDALQDAIVGLADDGVGSLWVATANRVLRVARDALARGGLRDADLREYGLADGLHSVEAVKRPQSVLADARGRIWFSMNRGLSVVDPARATGNGAAALAHIEYISVDGVPLDLAQPIRLSSASQRLTFGYTGLSLTVPERVKFQYRLDGFDRDWSPPGTIREAVYTNLNPGTYHFRVLASNSDGVWNGAEARVGFLIAPQVWQTWWFRLSAALALAGAAWVAFRIRMRQMARQLNLRFEERLAERTRIAQELHDTLLQGFISASMQLHVTASELPADSPAKSSLGRVLQLMRQVIDEGRNAVRGLRTPSADSNDLDRAFARIQQEQPHDQSIAFRVIVEGRSRPLHPVIRDEVYRIGREALVNAFRHAGAKSIEVELDYSAAHVRVLVRDDGCGIDPGVLRSGRDGHWGLSGMRERAERIGARLKLRSRAAAGTEVELSVPGHVAFPMASPAGPWKRLSTWFTRRPAAAPSEIEHDK